MQIIIDIPEETYKGIMLGKWDKNGLAYYVKIGTPLPKGHGRLIDADAIIKELSEMNVVDEKDKQSVRFATIVLEDAPTIIEEDK